jgi:anaerobic selenocysteine-containing dehydrogenase
MTAEITRIPAFCTQCRSRCGCVAVLDSGRFIKIEPLPGHPSGEKLCPKGLAAPELVYHPDRLTHPMRRTNPKGSADPGWQTISWEEALDMVAGKMKAIAQDCGPEQVAFSVTTPSGTHISDSISWIERLIRAFGSPNIIYGTEVCNWHKDFASRFTFGHDIGTPDFAAAECIMLWGNNPMATWLARAVEIQKAQRRGARLIVVDPRPTSLAKRADQWLRVRPGTDQVLALGLAHLLINNDVFQREFVVNWTNGPLLVRQDTGQFLRQCDLVLNGRPDIFYGSSGNSGRLLAYDALRGAWEQPGHPPQLRASLSAPGLEGPVGCRTAFDIYALAAAEYPPERVAEVTGIVPSDLQHAAEILAGSQSVAYYAWNGIGQSLTATQTDRAISLLYALTGSYGSPGGNVPGNAAPFADISGQDLLGPDQRAEALGLGDRPLGPPRQGWVTARDVYRAVLKKEPYPVRMLFSFGTNLMVSQPDPDVARRALESLEFHVHADFFINPTANYADLVLPVATSWEREGLRTGFDASLEGLRRVQLRPPVVNPVGEARSDTDIVMGLAGRLGLARQFFGLNADRGHDEVLSQVGISVTELRSKPEGITVQGTVPVRFHEATDEHGSPRGFPTPTRKVEIYSEQLLDHGYSPVPALPSDAFEIGVDGFPLRLSCAKVVAFCHSQHRNIASLRRLVPDPLVEMSPDDAAERGIARGDWVRIKTSSGHAIARAKLVPGLCPGCIVAQHGWWVEGPNGSPYDVNTPLAANLNRTISTERADPVSGSIPMRSSWCEVEKV